MIHFQNENHKCQFQTKSVHFQDELSKLSISKQNKAKVSIPKESKANCRVKRRVNEKCPFFQESLANFPFQRRVKFRFQREFYQKCALQRYPDPYMVSLVILNDKCLILEFLQLCWLVTVLRARHIVCTRFSIIGD